MLLKNVNLFSDGSCVWGMINTQVGKGIRYFGPPCCDCEDATRSPWRHFRHRVIGPIIICGSLSSSWATPTSVEQGGPLGRGLHLPGSRWRKPAGDLAQQGPLMLCVKEVSEGAGRDGCAHHWSLLIFWFAGST